MKTKSMTIWLMVVLLFLACPQLLATMIHFNDGQTHNIDYEIDDGVWVDLGAPGMQTKVKLLPGGQIPKGLYTFGNSQINISGGSIGHLDAEDSSEVTISGGLIEQNLYAVLDSHVTITGGSIGFEIVAGIPTHPRTRRYFDKSVITFVGSDFTINGQSVDYGQYSVFDYPSGGILAGTLANGGALNNPFFIRDGSSIVLVPEPATFLLLGLGAVMVRKRR